MFCWFGQVLQKQSFQDDVAFIIHNLLQKKYNNNPPFDSIRVYRLVWCPTGQQQEVDSNGSRRETQFLDPWRSMDSGWNQQRSWLCMYVRYDTKLVLLWNVGGFGCQKLNPFNWRWKWSERTEAFRDMQEGLLKIEDFSAWPQVVEGWLTQVKTTGQQVTEDMNIIGCFFRKATSA